MPPRKIINRPLSIASQLREKNSPISFSTSRASRTTIHDTLGIPLEKRNVRSPFILIGVGVVLCSSLLYNFLTTDQATKRKHFAELFADSASEEDVK